MLEGLACLALAVYFEARGEPVAGQLAVAQVVINRARSTKFPDTPCEVVKQGPTYKGSGHPVKYKCQFSFWCDGKPEIIHDHQAWQTAEEVAKAAWRTSLDITEGATFYHATSVDPKWRYTKTLTVRLGQHIFYKENRDGE
jgi:spore germination cell wall hydrolase CwlJ-like protein